MRQYSPSCDTSGSSLNECTVLTLLTPVRLRGEKWGYVNSRCDGSAVVLTQPCVCTLKLHFKPLFLRHVYQGASLCSLRKLQPSSPRGAEGRGGCGAREALRTFLLLESRSLRTVPNCSKYCRSCGSHSPRGRCPTYTTPGVSSSCGAQQPRHRGTDRDRTGQVRSGRVGPPGAPLTSATRFLRARRTFFWTVLCSCGSRDKNDAGAPAPAAAAAAAMLFHSPRPPEVRHSPSRRCRAAAGARRRRAGAVS